MGVIDRPGERGKPVREAVAMAAAFTVYFSVYGFRKPFTAAPFAGPGLLGLGFKELVVLAQVAGYTLAKFIGIGVIAEMRAERRIASLLALVAVAEGGLVLLAVLPAPWNAVGPALNGLCLGLTFGLVFGFLEGRRSTEALAAGLCASFIVADGVMKSVGAWLLDRGVPEVWMPAAAGLFFTPPLVLGSAVLARTPAPDDADEAARTVRSRVDGLDRRTLYRTWGGGLALIVGAYVIVTIIRSVRADFAPQLWAGLGVDAVPRLYTVSELWVALAVTALGALPVFVVGNRRAFLVSLATCLGGAVLLAAALVARSTGLVGPVAFMVLVGTAAYLPYVTIHTTVFERFIAATGSRGNAAFLLYVADFAGYLGYVIVLGLRLSGRQGPGSVPAFVTLCWCGAAGLATCSIAAWIVFARRTAEPPGAVTVESAP